MANINLSSPRRMVGVGSMGHAVLVFDCGDWDTHEIYDDAGTAKQVAQDLRDAGYKTKIIRKAKWK